MLTKAEAFALAYEQEISEHYIEHIARYMPGDEPTATAQLRSVIACIDRQEIGSPISVRFGPSDLTLADLDGFKLFLDRADVAVSREIRLTGTYEPHLSGFFRRIVKPGMVIVDIGANIGFYSMLFASLVGPQGRVLSFEPNSENCRLLLLSLDANGFDWVAIYPFALDDKPGALYFTNAYGTNGLILPGQKETLLNPNCVVIPAMRLDDLVNREQQVDLLKIDIEGAEYRALRGAEELIRFHHPIITAEFSQEMMKRVSGIDGVDFLKWMRGLGYRGYLLGRGGRNIEAIDDFETFMAGWGNYARIDDLAFIPAEMDFDPQP